MSSYCPINEKYNDADYNGKELFLYSSPVTAPDQERELMTWGKDEDEKKSDIPVVIKFEEQALYDMEILDKKLNLNGDAF